MQRRTILTVLPAELVAEVVVKDTTDTAAGAVLGVGELLVMAEQVRQLSATVDSLVRRAG